MFGSLSYREYKEKWIASYIENDFVIFPCNLNKTPGISDWTELTQGNSSEFYNSEDMSENKRNAQNNIGLLCGRLSGIIAIDVDLKDDGLIYWENLLSTNKCNDIDTLKVISGSGGYHYFFNWTTKMDKWISKNRIFSTPEKKIGIDFRSDNGYLIFPPSIHCDTANFYKFENISEPCNLRPKINDIPEWLFNIIDEKFQNL
jgi:hypothetical protein